MTESEKILKNALKLYWHAQDLLESEGYMVPNGYGGEKPHPALALQKQAFDQIKHLLPKNKEAGSGKTLDDLLDEMGDYEQTADVGREG